MLRFIRFGTYCGVKSETVLANTLKKPNRTLNIPNMLTILRILLTPLFVIFMLRDLFTHALMIFAIAGISDGLDGLLARYFDQRTELGAYLDPIADKFLLMAAFISLAVLKIIPAWLTVIVISRDVLIVIGIGVFSITNVNVQIKPSLVSKCTTLFQLLTVFLALLSTETAVATQLKQLLYWATAALTALSGMHYIYLGMSILQRDVTGK